MCSFAVSSQWSSFLKSEGQREDKKKGGGGWEAASAARQPALTVHLKHRRFHFRVLKLNPGGEYPHHAKQSISFSAAPYITDPPFPPDRMTRVIYHSGPARQRRGGAGAVPLQPGCLLPLAQRRPGSGPGSACAGGAGRVTEEVLFFHIIC